MLFSCLKSLSCPPNPLGRGKGARVCDGKERNELLVRNGVCARAFNIPERTEGEYVLGYLLLALGLAILNERIIKSPCCEP